MKITDVRAHALKTPLEVPFAFSQGWVDQRGATLVEIETDAGVTGWGETLCNGLQPPEIAASIVASALKPLLVGADPRDTEVLRQRMYNRVRDFGSKGVTIYAISGVDIALWDILGQSVGRPVWRLLGGAFRERVQVYATGFYRISGHGEAKRLVEEAEQRAGEGFKAMKIKLGFGVDDDIATLPAAHPSLFAEEPIFEYDCSAHPFRTRLVRAPLAHDDGWLELPPGAGLGIEVDRAAVKRFAHTF